MAHGDRGSVGVKTWVHEQAVLLALVVWATWLQLHALAAAGRLTGPAVATVLMTNASILAAQKVRSMANRQGEQNALAEVAPAHMHCAPLVARWSLIAQGLSGCASIATAPTVAHVFIALYVLGYEPVWRRFYRSRRPATLDSASADRLGTPAALDDGRRP